MHVCPVTLAVIAVWSATAYHFNVSEISTRTFSFAVELGPLGSYS